MSAPHHTRETDLAFLENLAFMLETGESFGTAAARFGVKEGALEKRVRAAKKRLRGGDRRTVSAVETAKIRGEINRPRQRANAVNPGPNHQIGVAS